MRLGSALQLALALILVSVPARAEPPRAELLGRYEWDLPQRWFGGISGIEMSRDGRQMTAITDRGRLFYCEVLRTDGVIEDIRLIRSVRLRGHDGAFLIGGTVDSEGLVVAPDGSVYISFEHVHRVSHYPDATGASKSLNRPQAFRRFSGNGGLEALAIDASDRLIGIPEDAFDADGNIPVYRWEDGTWSQPMTLASDGAFLPVGADFGPDGRLYLLERTYNIFGFRSRVRSWMITEDEALDERLVLQTTTGTHDNLEGLSVWTDADGRVRLTMVSDDNFFFLQDTELVEYAVIN